MDFNFRFSYVLLAGIAVVGVFSTIGFFDANAANMNMSDNMSMNGNATGHTTGNMTGHTTTGNMTGHTTTGNMTGHTTTGNMTGNMTGHTSTTNVPKILSPLQQLKSGVSAKSVQCNQGFTLIIKTEDGSPACVTSQNAQALTARGWGTTP
jgi:hypothetical protein